MPTKTSTWGVIGCGGMATEHLTALLRMRDAVNVVAVSDVFELRARHFQDLIWNVGGRAERTVDYRPGAIIWMSIFAVCAVLFFGIAAAIAVKGVKEIRELIKDPDLKPDHKV